MAQFTLFHYFRSSTSYRARIALNLKGIPYHEQTVNLLKGEQHLPHYRQVNSLGEIPSLKISEGNQDKIISQSMAIIEYLEELYPEVPLLPRDPFERAKIRQFCENINAYIHPLSNLKVLLYLEKNFGADQNAKNKWVQMWTEDGLASLERMVSSHKSRYLFGDQITYGEIFLIPALFTAQRFQIPIDKYPRLFEINILAMKSEAFQKAHPYNQTDTPEELRGKSIKENKP